MVSVMAAGGRRKRRKSTIEGCDDVQPDNLRGLSLFAVMQDSSACACALPGDVSMRWEYAWEQVEKEVELGFATELPDEVRTALSWVGKHGEQEVNLKREQMMEQIEAAGRAMRDNGAICYFCMHAPRLCILLRTLARDM